MNLSRFNNYHCRFQVDHENIAKHKNRVKRATATGMTAADKTEALDKHNALRSQAAAQDSAADMKFLVSIDIIFIIKDYYIKRSFTDKAM